MDQLYGEVLIASVNSTIDVVIPLKLQVKDAAALIAEMAYKSFLIPLDAEGLIIYNVDDNCLLDPESTFELAPVKDGFKLAVL